MIPKYIATNRANFKDFKIFNELLTKMSIEQLHFCKRNIEQEIDKRHKN